MCISYIVFILGNRNSISLSKYCIGCIQAQLQEQEKREREETRKRMTQKGTSKFGGQISTFSLGSGLSPKMSSPHTSPSPASVSVHV